MTVNSFYKYYRDNKKIDNVSFKSKYSFLYEFLNDLNKFNKLKTITEIYEYDEYDEYYYLSDAERKNMNNRYKPIKLFIEGYNYNDWYKNVESSDKEKLSDKEELVDLSDMPPLEGDEEEVKEGKGLKNLTPNKSLAKLSVLLALIKAENNSYKLKNEIRQILYLL